MMTLEDSIRSIIREELERVLAAPAATGKKWLTLSALADHLGLRRTTLHSLIAQGLPYIQPDKLKRFNVAECEAWIRDHKRAEAAE